MVFFAVSHRALQLSPQSFETAFRNDGGIGACGEKDGGTNP